MGYPVRADSEIHRIGAARLGRRRDEIDRTTKTSDYEPFAFSRLRNYCRGLIRESAFNVAGVHGSDDVVVRQPRSDRGVGKLNRSYQRRIQFRRVRSPRGRSAIDVVAAHRRSTRGPGECNRVGCCRNARSRNVNRCRRICCITCDCDSAAHGCTSRRCELHRDRNRLIRRQHFAGSHTCNGESCSSHSDG